MCVVLVVVGSAALKGQQGERGAVTTMDRIFNPTQYCFVEDNRMLVSHLVTYRTKSGSNRKRIGGGWEDPFEKALSAAIRRAALRMRKSGRR